MSRPTEQRQTKATRKALREYNADLLARVRRVPCPVCGAKRNKRCIGRWRETANCHADRHAEAKRKGHVSVSKGGQPW